MKQRRITNVPEPVVTSDCDLPTVATSTYEQSPTQGGPEQCVADKLHHAGAAEIQFDPGPVQVAFRDADLS
jgi:hypothetical protein